MAGDFISTWAWVFWLALILIFTDMEVLAPTLCLVGLIAYLLFYLVGLIRDLDNPF